MLSRKAFDVTQATRLERVRDLPVTPDELRRPAWRAITVHRSGTWRLWR